MTTTQPLELIHMDLFGLIAYLSIRGNKYGLIIVDDYSCFTWVFFLFDKCQVRDKVNKIRSDNGIKFKNTQVEGFLDEEGIKHEFSTPHTPQQNGVVERKNWTLIDMTRTNLDELQDFRFVLV
jgi:transposase InsO family protein